MNRMSFIHQIQWVVFLIVIYWSSENALAKKLPMNISDVKQAANCLRKSIGEDFIPQWFQKRLSYGEYIEEFCKEERIQKYNEEEIVTALKNCLHDLERDKVYEDYYKFGENKVKQLMVKNDVPEVIVSKDDEKFDESELKIPSPSKDDQKTKSSQIPHTLSSNKELKQSQSQSPVLQSLLFRRGKYFAPEDVINQTAISDLSKFIIGICFKDKPMNFIELDDDKDKKDAIDCLGDCVMEFFMKIESTLIIGKDEIQQNQNKKGMKDGEINRSDLSSEIKYIVEHTNIDELENKYVREFHKNGKHDFQRITEYEKRYLKLFEKVYGSENEYLDKIDTNLKLEGITLQHHFHIKKIIDNRLSSSFVYYKSCAKRQCFMKKSSLPLYDYIYDAAKRLDDETSSSTGTGAAPISTGVEEKKLSETEVELEHNTSLSKEKKTKPQPNFFEVLITNDDNNDEDLSHSEE